MEVRIMKKILVLVLALILALPMVANSESATATLQEMYAQAELLMAQGDYTGAAAKFEALGAYSDASQMTMYCKAIAAAETLGLYSMAIDAFNDLGDFKDSKQMAKYYEGRAYEASGNIDVTTASDAALEQAIWAYQEAEKIYGGLAFFKDSLTRMGACGERIKEIKSEQSRRAEAEKEATYQNALALEQSGDYAGAIKLYQTIKGYKDSNDRISICQTAINEGIYQEALALEQSGDYAGAVKFYQIIKGYKDSNDRFNECIYQQALSLEQNGDYAGAIALYQSIENHKDSAERIPGLYYSYAEILMSDGKWDEASEAFKNAGKYSDATERINEPYYHAALQMEAQEDYVGAHAAFVALGSYKDSVARAQQLALKISVPKAEALMAQSKYQEALELLTPLVQEEKVQQMIRTCNLRLMRMPKFFGKTGTALFYGNIEGESQLVAGLIDYQGNIIKPLGYIAYNDVSEWYDGLCQIKENNLYGYMNEMGDKIIPPQYAAATNFFQGKALVTRPDGVSCVIDTQGNTVGELPREKNRTYYEYVGEDLVSFIENGNWGLISFDGEEVLKAKYHMELSPFSSTGGIGKFKYGLAVVKASSNKGTQYGVIDAKGKEVVILGKYNNPIILSEDLIAVKGKDNAWNAQIINLKGQKKWSGVGDGFSRVGDIIVFNGSSKEYKYGALNLQLKEAIPFVYDDIRMGYQNKVVALQKNGLWSIYSVDDLTQPLIDRTITSITISPESPYVGLYNKDNKLGWFVWDSKTNTIY